ncbi:N amino acid transport system protein [Lachnellula occidentalis]|uniref:N amino acid transport system protein n=1 Tax=Lachnellula occidentalis TaxID=215460 RepID=A0A8H8UB74_9HELO|nr:N amino acid transport system protein [Lachnellula occidentalis]
MGSSEKKESDYDITTAATSDIGVGTTKYEETEVFATGTDGVEFRTVGWIRAAMFFTKMTFATGVLSVPSALYQLGAVAGAIFIVFWGAVNTYGAKLQGEFKILHPSVHTVSDMTHMVTMQFSNGSKKWSSFAREVAEFLYLMAWILCIGLAVLAFSTALNAISHHGTCTVAFSVVAYIIITLFGSVRKIHTLGWVLWIGFISIVSAVMIVVIAVTVPDRPAAAPQSGPFELGFGASPPPGTTFATAWAASIAVYASSANTSGYIPVISEMRRPQDYFKALYACMLWITSSYLALGLTIYAYCGKWVASPALGSAGPTIKIIAYAVAIPGLIAGGAICIHVSGKVLFVRFLRNTHHLTSNTKTHWAVWLSCTFGTGFLGWLCAEAIPFFTSLVSLIGSTGFAPLGICLPALLWFSMHPDHYRGSGTMKAQVMGHVALLILGIFTTVAGTYANISNIVDQYESGLVGSAFTCKDNSGSVS